jgi:deazaflavin-dependent oxidoreductase (nitroreductase family)
MWYNAIIVWLLRSPLHGVMSGNTLVVSYTGRKSGKSYATPVNYVRQGKVFWVTSLRQRSWWRNLLDGAAVRLTVQGRDISARGEALTQPEQVAEGLRAYFNAAPQHARYFQVGLDAQGQPLAEDLAREAGKRVVVRFEVS